MAPLPRWFCVHISAKIAKHQLRAFAYSESLCIAMANFDSATRTSHMYTSFSPTNWRHITPTKPSSEGGYSVRLRSENFLCVPIAVPRAQTHTLLLPARRQGRRRGVFAFYYVKTQPAIIFLSMFFFFFAVRFWLLVAFL